jgi:hypothetical protein
MTAALDAEELGQLERICRKLADHGQYVQTWEMSS